MNRFIPYQNVVTDLNNVKTTLVSLLKLFYNLGWATGSGGGISIMDKCGSIVIAPSGVQKEMVEEKHLFQISMDGSIITKPNIQNLKLSECTPLFLEAYKLRNAGAVLHSHSLNAVMNTLLFETEFQIKDFEMIKGIKGHKNTDWCVIPIIENTENECELTDRLRSAIICYPNSYAVLVRNHGVYIWGESWEKAKVHAECYEYLFRVVIEKKKLGFEVSKTVSCNEHVRSWVFHDYRKDIREANQKMPIEWIDLDYLNNLGLELYKLSGSQEDSQLKIICKERNYVNSDLKEISPKIDKYDELRNIFATEHIHSDEEIRYVLEGSGYFDVRDRENRWIRIHVTKGDLLILPEGIYHRYVPDITNYIHVMRLFQNEPKWTPINRYDEDTENHPSRSNYIKKIEQLK